MYFRYTDPSSRAEKDYVLRKPIVSVGRAPGNDIVLLDPSIAPLHAHLQRKPTHVTVSTADRGCEISVNGRRARSADLKPGDRIQVGSCELLLQDGEPQAAPAPSAAASAAGQVLEVQRLVDFSRRLMEDLPPDQLFTVMLKSLVELTPRLPKSRNVDELKRTTGLPFTTLVR